MEKMFVMVETNIFLETKNDFLYKDKNGVTTLRRQEKMITPFSYDSILFSFNLDTIETLFLGIDCFIAVGFFSKKTFR